MTDVAPSSTRSCPSVVKACIALFADLRVLHRLTELQKAMDAGEHHRVRHQSASGAQCPWRLRIGDHRVVHTVEDGQSIVWVLTVGSRRDIHRQVP